MYAKLALEEKRHAVKHVLVHVQQALDLLLANLDRHIDVPAAGNRVVAGNGELEEPHMTAITDFVLVDVLVEQLLGVVQQTTRGSTGQGVQVVFAADALELGS